MELADGADAAQSALRLITRQMRAIDTAETGEDAGRTPPSAPMEAELVSIVITCFNEERFIAEALESASGQTYSPTEVIVVDDGSEDHSLEVVRRIAPDATIVVKSNGGLSSARNAGLDVTRGELVVFLDGDDMLDPSFVEKTASLLHDHPEASFVYTQMQHFGRESKVSHWPQFNVPDLIRGNFITATSLIRRAACNEVRFDERLLTGWEDWDFFLGLTERGHTGVLLDEPLLLYRKHEDESRMSDHMVDPANKRRAHLRIMRKHLRLFGVRRYGHYLAHHAKSTISKSTAP